MCVSVCVCVCVCVCVYVCVCVCVILPSWHSALMYSCSYTVHPPLETGRRESSQHQLWNDEQPLDWEMGIL